MKLNNGDKIRRLVDGELMTVKFRSIYYDNGVRSSIKIDNWERMLENNPTVGTLLQ